MSSARASFRPAMLLAGSERAAYWSKRVRWTYRSGAHSTNLYGPVPMYCLIGPVPAASITSFGMIAAPPTGNARNASSGADGALSFITTASPAAVTESTDLYGTAPYGLTLPQRLSDATTSSAVIVFPLWNETPLRRVNV